MFRLPDLTHVVIVAGDSDYIALAQRCKRLGRYVIGIGVAGSTSKALAAACDEFDIYDSLPGIPALDRAQVRASVEAAAAAAASPDDDAVEVALEVEAAPVKKATRRGSGKSAAQKAAEKKAASADGAAGDTTSAADATAEASGPTTDTTAATAEASLEAALDAVTARTASAAPEAVQTVTTTSGRRAQRRTAAPAVVIAEPDDDDHDEDDEPTEDPQDSATNLLQRALELGHGKDDAEWLHSSAVKTHMKRMDPSFSEKSLGFRSFSDFVKARENIAELEETGHERLVRLRQP